MAGSVSAAVDREKMQKQEIRKSKVRVRVTYLMSITYAVTAVGLIAWLMYKDENELALGIFSGLASTSATIIAFWFGSRGSARTRQDDRAENRGSGSNGSEGSGAEPMKRGKDRGRDGRGMAPADDESGKESSD